MNNLFKGTLVAGAMLVGSSAFAQIQDEKNVTITMELVPILQLNMNTPDQVNFVFDEISEYLGGITKYGATILTASSTVSWDLFASGTSGAHQALATNVIWDAQVAYGNTGGSAIDELPLRALELRQFPAEINNGVAASDGDYGAAFTPVANPFVLGNNNVYVSATTSPYDVPAPLGVGLGEDRYIAGGDDPTSFVAGGSYLTQTAVAATGDNNAYYFVIDYRIVPGLPAIFPFATDGAGAAIAAVAPGGFAASEYAQPGVYTMNVKYLMIENQ
jgi:hypothetical protein